MIFFVISILAFWIIYSLHLVTYLMYNSNAENIPKFSAIGM